MAVLVANTWRLLLMLVLLLCSGFFSGSETAFFNISRRQLQGFAASDKAIEKAAAWLLRIPNRLLTSMLLGNMLVNVLYYALSSVLAIRLAQDVHPAAGGATAVLSFIALLLLGEMMPKSLAYSHALRFCRAATPFCYIFVRVLAPLLAAFEWTVVKPAVRLLVFRPGIGRNESADLDQLKVLIETTRQEGLITRDENRLLIEILELGRLKVRHIMRPRVDMPACDVTEPPEKIRSAMHQKGITRILIYSRSIDNLLGVLHIRRLLLAPNRPVHELLDTVDFVPEQKTVESLIQFFHQRGCDLAVAVDEYGGIAGLVTHSDIVSELVEPLGSDYGNLPPIEQLGPMRYRLAGDLPIHDWAKAFGIHPEKSRVATVGGFVAGLLGRVPHPGDAVNLGHVKLTVERVHRRRVETLILTLERIGDGPQQEGGGCH